MDIKQEEITTLHDICIDKTKFMKVVSDIAVERPVSVVIPMLYSELQNDALGTIISSLNKCKYLNQVIISLAAANEKEFNRVKHFFSTLTIPKLIMWCNDPKIENLLSELQSQGLDLTKSGGKGRDVWLAFGIASLNSYAIALHDADIRGYDELIPTKLIYPLLEPELDFKFNKAYYARINLDKTMIYGRVFRLFLHPLLRSLVDVLHHEPNFIRFLRAFRYPLSGEFAITNDLARDFDIPYGWGLEIGALAEVYRNISMKRACQTDLGFYEHKHQDVGDSTKGLVKMSNEIFKSLLRVLIEEDHIQVTPSFLLSLRILYHKNAQDSIKKYHADAHFNAIDYDRHLEETIVEKFGDELMAAGNSYTFEPMYNRLPDWLRTISARRKIREELFEIVKEQNKKTT
jgi:glucosyl-3-phosphoglycerate synthase